MASSLARISTEPLDAGGGEDSGVVLAFLHPAHPRRHVAAQVDELEVGAIAREKRPPSQAARADATAGRQGHEAGASAAPAGEPDIARILALEHRGERQPRRQLGRQIIQAVHREVHMARGERLLDLLGEERLAGDLRKRPVENVIPLGADLEDLDLRRAVEAGEKSRDMVCLPECQLGATGADAERAVHDDSPWTVKR